MVLSEFKHFPQILESELNYTRASCFHTLDAVSFLVCTLPRTKHWPSTFSGQRVTSPNCNTCCPLQPGRLQSGNSQLISQELRGIPGGKHPGFGHGRGDNESSGEPTEEGIFMLISLPGYELVLTLPTAFFFHQKLNLK